MSNALGPKVRINRAVIPVDSTPSAMERREHSRGEHRAYRARAGEAPQPQDAQRQDGVREARFEPEKENQKEYGC